MAFWFAPTVTQNTSNAKFDMFHLSTIVYAWKENIWADY